MFNLAIMEMQNFRAAVLFHGFPTRGKGGGGGGGEEAHLILQRHSAHYAKIFNEGRLPNLQLRPLLRDYASVNTRVKYISLRNSFAVRDAKMSMMTR